MLGEKQGYFLDFPVILLFAHPLVRFARGSVTHSVSNTRVWACSLNCKPLSQERCEQISCICNFDSVQRVFGTLSADLVSEIYIQSTNTNENIKPGQRQTLWVCTCSHFPVRSWLTDDLSSAVFHLLPFQPHTCLTESRFSVMCSWESTGRSVHSLVKPRPASPKTREEGSQL